MNRLFILFSFILVACVQRSNDPILDVDGQWASGDYILNQDGDSKSLAILQAKELVIRQDFRRAWQVLNTENLQYEVDPELSFLKGKVQFELGNIPAAARLLEDAGQLGYTGGELNELLVRVYLEIDREDDATELSRMLVEQQPTAENMSLRAQVLLATGDSLGAKRFFANSMKSDSTLRMNYLGLEQILSGEKAYERAVSIGEASVRRFPSDAEMIETYAEILEASGNYREAIQTTNQLMKLTPDDPELLSWRASLYLNSRQYDSAVYSASASLVFREDPATKMILASAMERQRLYTNALQVYREVFEADSANTEAGAAVRRLEGRQRYLRYLRQQQDSTRQQSADSSASNSN